VATPIKDSAALIERYIELDRDHPVPAEARLVDSYIHVWAIVGHYLGTGRDPQNTADSYEVPLEAVLAALSYYRQHQCAIDARLELNNA
jgi:uncharacterized protein (DUF433 family)